MRSRTKTEVVDRRRPVHIAMVGNDNDANDYIRSMYGYGELLASVYQECSQERNQWLTLNGQSYLAQLWTQRHHIHGQPIQWSDDWIWRQIQRYYDMALFTYCTADQSSLQYLESVYRDFPTPPWNTERGTREYGKDAPQTGVQGLRVDYAPEGYPLYVPLSQYPIALLGYRPIFAHHRGREVSEEDIERFLIGRYNVVWVGEVSYNDLDQLDAVMDFVLRDFHALCSSAKRDGPKSPKKSKRRGQIIADRARLRWKSLLRSLTQLVRGRTAPKT